MISDHVDELEKNTNKSTNIYDDVDQDIDEYEVVKSQNPVVVVKVLIIM